MLERLESKKEDNLKLNELKKKCEYLINENEELKKSLKESQINLASAECEISNIKAINYLNNSLDGGSFKFANNPTIIQSNFETDEEMGLN